MDTHLGKRIRQLILEESKRAQVGHIASALSVADIIAVLFDGILRGIGSEDQERDRFVMSKGHAALAVYAALYCRGILSRTQLATYCQDGTMLGTHPEHRLPGIDFSTGSLGQGLSIGVGAALAARLSKSSRRVFVVVSDAECNEGSLWEGVMFAAQHELSALTVIVDNNGQQAMGYTRDVLSQENAAERWRAFGWKAVDIDGHNRHLLESTLQAERGKQPLVIIASTQAGHGVSFMEQQVKWHYLPMSEDEYQQALAEVEQAS